MDKPADWLEETWEIKRGIAQRYAGVPMSQQLSEMHICVLEEFRKRGWEYPEPSFVGQDSVPSAANGDG